MKLERISDNQIRCTLNKQDLQERELRVSELAYGTEKAKELFRDMMQQASYELGFEAEDIPLMIEAIPVSQESLVLIITKVDDPDELDTRFSKFSTEEEDFYEEEDEEDLFGPDLLSMTPDNLPIENDDTFVPLQDAIAPENVIQKKTTTQTTSIVQAIRIFSFSKLDDVIDMAKELHTQYQGSNSLYKDTDNGVYYLLMSKDNHSLEEFNRICNFASDFGKAERSNYATLSYYEEHYECIAKTKAIAVLSKL